MRCAIIVLLAAVCCVACASSPQAAQPRPSLEVFDVLLRGGTIVDGTGSARYVADVGIRGDRITAIGDLRGARAVLELDVTGLFVTPGFINIHSHALPAALPTAVNMLTQGVTTELRNPDGAGPLDIAEQLTQLVAGGLAVNVGAYAPFNAIWARVVGASDVRPNTAQMDTMSQLVVQNLERGAWGVSAGLDYKPAYYATESEVVHILRAAGRWRTNFPNHDRVIPETGYSSRAGVEETMRIGFATRMLPVITHMKVTGKERGTAGVVLNTMSESSAQHRYVAADVYPYLAGQTALVALIIPAWAQDGGRPALLQRFADPAQRARIAREADEAINARFLGAQSIYVTTLRKDVATVMREMGLTSAGETVIRILEEGSPGAIIGFGTEADLVRILQHPTTSIACDCGAALTQSHPRYYGSFPRVLGRYVREQRVLTWEDAVRKMTALPAATIGMADRGMLAPGMAADVVVFDTATIIDRATFEEPMLLSEGVRHVLVNGIVAMRDGRATGERGGRALSRTTWMPSRPMSSAMPRSVSARGNVSAEDGASAGTIEVNVSQNPDAKRATGTFRFTDARTGVTVTSTTLGHLQTTAGWASFTGVASVEPGGAPRTFTIYVEVGDPFMRDTPPSVTVQLDGASVMRLALPNGQVTVLPRR